MHEQSSSTENPETRYETSDARMGPIVAIGIGIIVLGFIAHGVSLGLFDYFRANTSEHDPKLPALAAKERVKLPQDVAKVRAPQLQVGETRDLAAFRMREEARLQGYGWVDARDGKVHIPIEEAMRVLADPERAKLHGIKVAPAKGSKQ